MPRPREKALNSLAVYLRRGYEAREACSSLGAEDFLNVMTEREAAFHNFRCFEDQARRAGLDVANDPEVRRLMALVAPQTATLTSLVAAALIAIQSQLARTSAARNAARAYHTGRRPPARYVKQS